MKRNEDTVHIIGAGISGLGCGYYLDKKNIDSVIYEHGNTIGGRAGCLDKDGHTLEIGGKNFSSGWSLFNELLKEYGFADFDIQHPRFHIVMDGKLIDLDKKRTLSGDLSLARALGIRGAIQFKKLLSEAWKNADKLDHSNGLIEEYERRYDHKPINKHFARKLAYGPLRMFSIIMGAAEPDETYYSNLLLFVAGFAKGSHHSMTGGIGQLFNKMAEHQTIHFNTRLERIIVENAAIKGLQIKTPQGSETLDAKRVISALPLHVLRDTMVFPKEVTDEIDRIRYYPVIMVNAIYDGDVFTDEMNSIMFDESFHLGHCSANRMYQKNHVRFTISGRRARDIMDWPDEKLIDLAEKEFGSVHPIRVKRVFYHVTRHRGGICAYAPYFSQARRKLLEYVESIEGLEIAGDYLEGHAMGECLQSSWNAVNRLC